MEENIPINQPPRIRHELVASSATKRKEYDVSTSSRSNTISFLTSMKFLLASVVILFLLWISLIISSMVSINQLRHETLQSTIAIRKLADLQNTTWKAMGIEYQEVHKTQASLERNCASATAQLHEIENKLQDSQQNHSGQTNKLTAASRRIYEIRYHISRITRSRLEQKFAAQSPLLQRIEINLRSLTQRQSNQTREIATVFSEMQAISSMPFLERCENIDLAFMNISEGTGRVVRILPSLGGAQTYCEQKDDQMWTVIQRRKDGSINFVRDWDDYVRGFGNAEGEFWLGLEAIHQLTKSGQYLLRIDMEVDSGTRLYAVYSTFSVASKSEYYRLSVGGYSGNATDSLYYSDGEKFTTKDHVGAWWYGSTFASNLNGLYGSHNINGIAWSDVKYTGKFALFFNDYTLYPLYIVRTEMKLRKKN